MKKEKKNIGPYVELSFAAILAGSNVIVGKLIIENFPIFLALGLRFLIASSILIPLLKGIEGSFPRLTKKEFLRLFLQSFTGLFLFSIFLLYGLRLTSAVQAGVITGGIPAITALLAFLLLKEEISLKKGFGILLAVFGLISINAFDPDLELGVSRSSLWGNLFVFGAVIGEALFTVLGKAASKNISPLAISTIISALAFGMFLPFALYEGISFDFSKLSLTDWLPIFYYGIVLTVLSFFLWYRGVSKVPTSTAAVFTSLIPVSAVILSLLFLQEQMDLSELIGMTLVVIAIYLVSTKSKSFSS